jgi:hypothetical protein
MKPPSPERAALERIIRAVQGNFDHMDLTIEEVSKKHNNLDDNVQELVDRVNETLADFDARLQAGGL